MKRTIDYKRAYRLFKEGFWVVFGQVMAVSGSFLGVRLLTEYLDPLKYGELALGMTVATMINQVLLGPLCNGVARFYAPAEEKEELGAYLKSVYRLGISATGVALIMLSLAVVGLFFIERIEWIGILVASFVFAIFNGYNSILDGIQNAARQRSIVALHQGFRSWIRFIIAIVFVLWLGASSIHVMVGYALGVLLLLGSQIVFFNKFISGKVKKTDNDDKNWYEEIFKYAWPYTTWGVFTWAQLSSDRWALGFFSTTQDVGFYAVLFQLSYYPISIATNMITMLLAPIFYQRAGDATNLLRNSNAKKLNTRLTWLAFGTTIAAFLVTFFFHKYIFMIFVAKEYVVVSYLLPWMVLAAGVFAIGETISLNIATQMKTHLMVLPKIVTGILGVLLNFIGAYYYGIKGVVIAYMLFSVIYWAWMNKIVSEKCNLKLVVSG